MKVWVKLGTANMNWNLSINNSQTWNTGGGKTFTSSDGLNTSTYTQLTYYFVCPVLSTFTLHVGSHSNTTYGQAAQIAGTSSVYGWQIFVKGKQSLLESNLAINGTLKANDIIFGTSGFSLNSTYGYINLRLTTISCAVGITDLAWTLASTQGDIVLSSVSITLPTIGTYIIGGKVKCTTSSVITNGVVTYVSTSINAGSSWNIVYTGNGVAGGGDIDIRGLITTTVVNQQVKVSVENGMSSNISLSSAAVQSFCYIYKVCPF